EEHDQAMADCHALTFFVAKGLMDAEVNLGSPFAPPSAKAIARTVREVRSDSGHLFEILHRQNPYAADARGRFLEALSNIDRALASAEREGVETSLLAIPALDQASPELRETRNHIDKLDNQLLNLLARRLEFARRAGSAKAELGHGVRDPEREGRLLNARRDHAEVLGMDPDSVEDVFQAILRLSRRAQRSSPD
ncbi:MAG TPA: prephenate dehydrogenase/arogenate dehydrogenase family protein, partial [Myxococcales bacterium]|nr:prephenate dehydrogenase/arogenate dehydrogenase family protein [Myxococcales bacterium]